MDKVEKTAKIYRLQLIVSSGGIVPENYKQYNYKFNRKIMWLCVWPNGVGWLLLPVQRQWNRKKKYDSFGMAINKTKKLTIKKIKTDKRIKKQKKKNWMNTNV